MKSFEYEHNEQNSFGNQISKSINSFNEINFDYTANKMSLDEIKKSIKGMLGVNCLLFIKIFFY
jgi:hypothetical protein